jgi:hypothetical protein
VNELPLFTTGDMMNYPMNAADVVKIENSFTYHSPKDDQPERYGTLRELAKTLAMTIHSAVPPGRERALAITKLEEAIMWANKGIACGE